MQGRDAESSSRIRYLYIYYCVENSSMHKRYLVILYWLMVYEKKTVVGWQNANGRLWIPLCLSKVHLPDCSVCNYVWLIRSFQFIGGVQISLWHSFGLHGPVLTVRESLMKMMTLSILALSHEAITIIIVCYSIFNI